MTRLEEFWLLPFETQVYWWMVYDMPAIDWSL